MQTIICSVCGEEGNLREINEGLQEVFQMFGAVPIGHWWVSRQDDNDLCPKHYEEFINKYKKARLNILDEMRQENGYELPKESKASVLSIVPKETDDDDDGGTVH